MKKTILLSGIVLVAAAFFAAVFFFFSDQGDIQRACPAIAHLCPDGSSVAPSGPRCEFAPCPIGRRENEKDQPMKKESSNRSETPLSQETKPSVPAEVSVEYIDDSVSTLENPKKIFASDGKHYFMFGQPKGQNDKSVKKIIFSLPGHGSTAEQDYAAWKKQITDDEYALASLNWWDGDGEKTTDYYQPTEVLAEIKYFLDRYGYAAEDFVVLEGFSRGSANTYAVKAYDMYGGIPVIDAVISASGKYQSDFAMTPELLTMNGGKIFSGVPWILVCGAKDPHPTRDGCEGMSETKTFLSAKGARVLGLLEDPNGGHGAFHTSPLKLVDKAFSLLDALPESK